MTEEIDNVDTPMDTTSTPTETVDTTTTTTNWYDDIGLDADYIKDNQASFDKYKDVSGVVKSGIESSKKISELTGQIQKAPETYEVENLNEETAEAFTGLFKEAGLTNDSAQKLIDGYNKMEEAQRESMYSQDALNEVVPEAKQTELQPFLRENMTEDQMKAFDGMTSKDQALMYQFAEKIKADHGINEGSGQVDTQPITQDLDKEYDSKYDEIIAYDKQPNQDPQHKAKLVMELEAITQKKMRG